MTTPTTNKTATKATKSTPAKVEDNIAEVAEAPVATVPDDTSVNRIPELFENNPILKDFCQKYLDILDEITEYNKQVLAEKTAEWNSSKVLEKAKEFAHPEDANVPANKEIQTLVDEWEKAITVLAQKRKAVIERTAKELGITLTSTAERDPEKEAGLKEQRKLAHTIGSQLSSFAEMINDASATKTIQEFLGSNPLPAVGRDQSHNFSSDGGKATPKYRVKVTVSRDNEELISEDGFTKAALALPKYYERGKALKADKLREAWEAAGNTPEKTVTDPVEFNDNGLHFTITKK